MARQLVVHGGLPSTSSIPSPAKRLLGKRSDKVLPTLVFSEEELETAERMFTMGRFRKGHFQELTKEHLMCPKNQNQRLTKNLVLEKAVRDLDRGKGQQAIRTFRDNLILFGIDLRTAHRPFVLSVGVNMDLARYLRAMGEQLGFTYPKNPPQLTLYGPNKVTDYLTPATTPFLPMP